jgi:hypothetical protein
MFHRPNEFSCPTQSSAAGGAVQFCRFDFCRFAVCGTDEAFPSSKLERLSSYHPFLGPTSQTPFRLRRRITLDVVPSSGAPSGRRSFCRSAGRCPASMLFEIPSRCRRGISVHPCKSATAVAFDGPMTRSFYILKSISLIPLDFLYSLSVTA